MERRFKKRGVQVVVRGSGDAPRLELDGRPIEVVRKQNRFFSKQAPELGGFSRLDELAAAILRTDSRFSRPYLTSSIWYGDVQRRPPITQSLPLMHPRIPGSPGEGGSLSPASRSRTSQV